METNRQLLIEKAEIFKTRFRWTGLDGMSAGEVFREVARRFTDLIDRPAIAAEARKLAGLCEKYGC